VEESLPRAVHKAYRCLKWTKFPDMPDMRAQTPSY
jgi:hypothetical protein